MRAKVFAFSIALLALNAATDGAARGGDEKQRAIAVIENDLVADDPAVRLRAAAELTDRFPDGAVAVPMLVDLLDDEDAAVVAAAARAIDSMAVAGAPVLTAFCMERSRFEGPNCFGRTLEGLVTLYISNPLDGFGVEDDPDDPLTVERCAAAAVVIRDHAPGEVWWRAAAVAAFRRTEGATREMTAVALAMLGADAVAERSIALTDDNRRAPAARALVPLIESDYAVQAFCGARIAARLRCAEPMLLRALGICLTKSKLAPDSWSARGIRFAPAAAADAFASIGPDAVGESKWLFNCVKYPPQDRDSEESADLVDRCVRALIRTGREHKFREVLHEDPERADHLALVAARAGCSPSMLFPRFAAEAGKPGASYEVFLGLRAVGPAAMAVLPLAKARLREADDDGKRLDRAETVLAISPDDAEALDVIDALLGDHDISASHSAPDTANYAWYTLCERAAPTPMVLRRLTAGVTRETRAFGFREGAAALGRAGPAAKGAVPALVELLPDLDTMNEAWQVTSRVVVVVALGRIGPDAAAAIPALTALRDKGDETIRVPAAQALRRIRAKK